MNLATRARLGKAPHLWAALLLLSLLLSIPTTAQTGSRATASPAQGPAAVCTAPGPALDLRHCDFSYRNLRGVDLAGADLRGVSLAFADLTGADLSGARLAQARLTSATLRNADLTSAELVDADLRMANLHGARLDHADASAAELSGAAVDPLQILVLHLDDTVTPSGAILGNGAPPSHHVATRLARQTLP